MQMDRYEHAVPSWVDLATGDVERAVGFYCALFGWDAPEGPPETGGYRVCELGGCTVAGIGPQMSPGPVAWATYVNVDEADAIADKVAEHGGRVLAPPFDVVEAGRMGVFADPAGAVFGVWQPRQHLGAGVVNEPGAWCWSELVTTDVERSIEFYGAVFGWGAVTHGEGPAAYTEWQVGGRPVAGMMAKPEAMPAEAPPYWGVYFAVADADQALARISELGGKVVMGPVAIEPGRFVLGVDPTGGMFAVIEMAAGGAPTG